MISLDRITIPIKGSRPTGQLHHRTMPARPLHRVVIHTRQEAVTTSPFATRLSRQKSQKQPGTAKIPDDSST